MAEKILYEYRVEQDEQGYLYTYQRGEQHVEIRSTQPLEGWGCHGRAAGWMQGARRAFRQGRQRRHHAARKVLDTLEGMYRDIYGPEAEGPQPQAGTAE